MNDPIGHLVQKSIDPSVLWPRISPLMAGLTPKTAQQRILCFMHKNKGLLVWHGTGTGKTLAALICAVDFLRRRKRNQVIIICEPSTIDSVWKQSIHKYIRCAGSDPQCVAEVTDIISRIFIMTIDAFQKYTDLLTFIQQENRYMMLIVDEAHQYRGAPVKMVKKTTTTKKKTLVTVPTDLDVDLRIGKSYAIRKACINTVAKVIFLTATPIVNSLNDFRNIFQNILIVYEPKDEYNVQPDKPDITLDPSRLEETMRAFSNMYDFASDIKKPHEWPNFEINYEYLPAGANQFITTASTLLKNRRSVAMNAARSVSVITVPKDRTKSAADIKKEEKALIQELRTHARTTKDLDPFLDFAKTKDIIGSSKIDFLLGKVQATRCETWNDLSANPSTARAGTTSAPTNLGDRITAIFIDLGVDIISSFLPLVLEKKYPQLHGRIYTIIGKTSRKSRIEQLSAFNEPRRKGEPGKVIILSKAGNTGLELKGVDYVFIMDGSWTQAEFLQILGRQIRTNSHVHIKSSCVDDRDCGAYESYISCNPDHSCAIPNPVVQIYVLLLKDEPNTIRFADIRESFIRGQKATLMIEAAELAQKHRRRQSFTINLSPHYVSPATYPPEFREWINATFGIKNNMLDIYQASSIYLTQSVSMIFPIKANEYINHMYNQVRAGLVERIMNTLYDTVKRQRPGTVFRYVHLLQDKHKKVSITAFPDLQTQPLHDTDCVCIYVETAQIDGFGHFGAFFYDGNNLSFYDSMLRRGKTSGYLGTFTDMLAKALPFFRPRLQNLIVDFDDTFYSMEDTGGQNDVFNSGLAAVTATTRWFLESLLLGPDAQNQYCYMWAIMYLVCKVLHFCDDTKYMDWLTLCEKITTHEIIPLVVVKLFILLSSGTNLFKSFQPLWKNEFISTWYPCFTSNSKQYRSTLDPANQEFSIYKIHLTRSQLKNSSVVDSWRRFLHMIENNTIVYKDIDHRHAPDRYETAILTVVGHKLIPPRSTRRKDIWSPQELDTITTGNLDQIVDTYLKKNSSLSIDKKQVDRAVI